MDASNFRVEAGVVYASSRRLYEDAFHFVPTLGVEFRFMSYADSDADYERFRQNMLQATLLLLEHAQDAVLLFNGETIVLQRFGGKLVFNSDYHIFEGDDWLRSRLSLPFDRRPLPSPWR
ncbi:SitI3 family protein [Archangium sp.]|uniref:SitI3 family protein n=1 Tax=Archangium sp. TaxID=1872627 RepID=UPI00286D52BC|nr:SitI3 family protein [Archangium sp.]